MKMTVVVVDKNWPGWFGPWQEDENDQSERNGFSRVMRTPYISPHVFHAFNLYIQ